MRRAEKYACQDWGQNQANHKSKYFCQIMNYKGNWILHVSGMKKYWLSRWMMAWRPVLYLGKDDPIAEYKNVRQKRVEKRSRHRVL